MHGGNGRPLMDMPVYVEVTSLAGSSMRGYTDSDGRVNFEVASGTNYKLIISGPSIKSTNASFAIPPSERFFHEDVQVDLAKGTATKGAGGMVSAATLQVPEKARHEFAAGMKEMKAQDWSKAREHFEKAIKVPAEYVARADALGAASYDAWTRARPSRGACRSPISS